MSNTRLEPNLYNEKKSKDISTNESFHEKKDTYKRENKLRFYIISVLIIQIHYKHAASFHVSSLIMFNTSACKEKEAILLFPHTREKWLF